MRYVTTAFMRSVTLSAVMISWPAMSIVCSRRSTSTTLDAATPRQNAYSTRRQRLDVLAIDERHTDMVAINRADVEHLGGAAAIARPA